MNLRHHNNGSSKLVCSSGKKGFTASRAFRPLTTKKPPSELPGGMGKIVESVKRRLEDLPPAPGMSSDPGPWFDLGKNKSRFKVVPHNWPDDRPRHDHLQGAVFCPSHGGESRHKDNKAGLALGRGNPGHWAALSLLLLGPGVPSLRSRPNCSMSVTWGEVSERSGWDGAGPVPDPSGYASRPHVDAGCCGGHTPSPQVGSHAFLEKSRLNSLTE
ncbi:hypothetical protein HPB47_019420 [Ixodes persulcatus]|uniref:Uncharacterized protein n=1 Tax=Ixodes persulcatus TaxID=34615 RepID=A0AC60QJ28_IXOPE|nr:hypothetical protein HPB47_019420 [Ixodes persulcatus]